MNVYYDHEKLGLEKVGELEAGGSYEFDTFCVWRDDKAVYYATDGGCSCPTPFENYDGVESLTRVDRSSLKGAIRAWRNEGRDDRVTIAECDALVEAAFS